MRQHPSGQIERRREPRHSAAFAFWVHPEGSHQRHAAWMLDYGQSGTAFLIATEHAPAIGTRIELDAMPTNDRFVQEELPTLPSSARVIRHDPSDGLTKRVAARFDVPLRTILGRPDSDHITEARPLPRSASVPAAPGPIPQSTASPLLAPPPGPATIVPCHLPCPPRATSSSSAPVPPA